MKIQRSESRVLLTIRRIIRLKCSARASETFPDEFSHVSGRRHAARYNFQKIAVLRNKRKRFSRKRAACDLMKKKKKKKKRCLVIVEPRGFGARGASNSFFERKSVRSRRDFLSEKFYRFSMWIRRTFLSWEIAKSSPSPPLPTGFLTIALPSFALAFRECSRRRASIAI